MAKERFRATHAGKSSRVLHQRHGLENEILLSLPVSERDHVFAEMHFVELPVEERLTETGAPIEYGFFLNCGLASVLSVMGDGKSVEVGLTGKEGFVGLPLVAGLRTSAHRTVMQVAGCGFRVCEQHLRVLLQACPSLDRKLNRYAQEFALQSAQGAACNRLHSVEQRLARWLLMSHDRLGESVVALTQDSLANMLGTRRASVTVACGVLENNKLIKSSRGVITILNRGRLAAAACECYQALTRQTQSWRSE